MTRDQVHAWILALPAAALTLAAIVWLAEPLSELLEPSGDLRFFESLQQFLNPEPVEQARYLLAAAGAVGYAAALGSRRVRAGLGSAIGETGSKSGGTAKATAPVVAAIAAQLAFAAFAVVCVVEQSDVPMPETSRLQSAIFETWHWVAAVALAAGAVALITGRWRKQAGRVVDRLDLLLAERRWIAPAVAVVVTALWLLPSVYTDENVAGADPLLLFHLPLLHDEYAAAVNGLTPFVDYTAIYNFVLPMLAHPLLDAWGYGVTGFSALMVALTLASLLAVYGLLSNAVARRAASLGLYLAFLALALYPVADAGAEILFAGNAYGNLPARYFGPLLAGWLAIRHLRRGSPAPVTVFAVAGLAALNNADMGLAAFAAVGAALWLGAAGERSSRQRGRGLLIAAAAGAAIAIAFVSALTLVRAGALPDLGELLYFARIFGREGFALSPMPDLGLHLVLYATFAGALAVAALRARRAESAREAPDEVGAAAAHAGAAGARASAGGPAAEAYGALTGALAFAGLFGLLAGVYYVGESEPTRIVALFLPWGIAIGLLAYVAIGALAAARDRGGLAVVALPASAVLVALALSAVVAVRFPEPWTQADRIARSGPEFYGRDAAAEFVRANTRPDEPVSILSPLGHVTAEDAGLTGTFPFDDARNVKTYDQMDRVVSELREAGGEVLFVSSVLPPEVSAHLRSAGYEPARTGPGVVGALTIWREAR